jgi:hypothetical protein
MNADVLDLPEDVALLSDREWAAKDDWRRHRRFRNVGILSSMAPVTIPFGDARFVFSEPLPDWSREAIMRVCQLGDLAQDWDSYGARPIDPHCARAAIEVILAVLGPSTASPAIIPTNRGGIQLEWHRGGVDLEVEVVSRSRLRVSYEDGLDEEEFETQDYRPLVSVLDCISRKG